VVTFPPWRATKLSGDSTGMFDQVEAKAGTQQ